MPFSAESINFLKKKKKRELLKTSAPAQSPYRDFRISAVFGTVIYL